MTIGQLARAAGVNVETIRYYQRRGLIATPRKPIGGQRQYAGDALRHLAFIRRAQDLGFTLEEIRALLTMLDGGNCAHGRSRASAKFDELGARVDELQRMRLELARLMKLCDGNKRGQRCPFIAVLDGGD